MPRVPGRTRGTGDGLLSQTECVRAVLLEEPSEVDVAFERSGASMTRLLTDDVLSNAGPSRLGLCPSSHCAEGCEFNSFVSTDEQEVLNM